MALSQSLYVYENELSLNLVSFSNVAVKVDDNMVYSYFVHPFAYGIKYFRYYNEKNAYGFAVYAPVKVETFRLNPWYYDASYEEKISFSVGYKHIIKSGVLNLFYEVGGNFSVNTYSLRDSYYVKHFDRYMPGIYLEPGMSLRLFKNVYASALVKVNGSYILEEENMFNSCTCLCENLVYVKDKKYPGLYASSFIDVSVRF